MDSISGLNSKYPKDYLKDAQEQISVNDAKEAGGNGDGKLDVDECYNSYFKNYVGLFDGIDKNSDAYNSLIQMGTNLKDVVAKYAGDDGVFSEEEYLDLLNGEEWSGILEVYRNSNVGYLKREMEIIDKNGIEDGDTTKGEIKTNLSQNMKIEEGKVVKEEDRYILSLVDKYAGDDGVFDVEEYKNFKNDSTVKNYIRKFGIGFLGIIKK